jgi:hypothetical protein
MRFLVGIAAGLFLLTLPSIGHDTLHWSVANGLGFFACIGLIAVMVFRLRAPPQGAGYDFHKDLSWWILGAVVLHVVLLLFDGTVINYLLPGAPAYMWAGWAAGLLLILVCLISGRQRRRTHFERGKAFRYSHLAWAWALLGFAAWHILISGYYLPKLYLQVGFLVIFMVLPAWVIVTRKTSWLLLNHIPTVKATVLLGGVFMVVFVGVRVIEIQ